MESLKINCALTVNAVAVGKLFMSLNIIDIARACFVVMKLNAYCYSDVRYIRIE